MSQTLTVEYGTCEDCDQDFPRAELLDKYSFGAWLWCQECQNSYDPTPYDQWEVTTPREVGEPSIEYLVQA